MPVRTTRAVATDYGAFYTESLRIVDQANQRVLVRGADYFAAELYEVPTARFGKEVCAIVVITNASVSANVSISYQAVGGEFGSSVQAIIQQIANMNLDERPLGWGSVIDKPSEYTPSHHLHDLGDIYGFEYVVHAIDRVRAAILMGDVASHDEIYAYVDLVLGENAGTGANTDAALAQHVNNRNNPHNVTLAQLGAYNRADVDYLIGLARQELRTDYLGHITYHNNRSDNPHGVTAAQIGLGNVRNYPIASYDELVRGESNTAYATPLIIKLREDLHNAGGGHDDRYVRKDTPGIGVEGSIHAPSNGYAYVWVSGGWRAFWPPQWQ
jgi:hypothetical protein